jgi:hypothetical protein
MAVYGGARLRKLHEIYLDSFQLAERATASTGPNSFTRRDFIVQAAFVILPEINSIDECYFLETLRGSATGAQVVFLRQYQGNS